MNHMLGAGAFLQESDYIPTQMETQNSMLTSHKNPTLAQLCLKFREENTFQTA